MPLYSPPSAYAPGGTDVAVADGGTGSSTASGAATNLGLGTGDSPQFTAINLGHASDTTITRVSAGVIAVEGVTVVSGSGVTVQDEGTPLATTGTTLNFVGAGVAATGTGATKTVTISGGSGNVATDTIYDAKGDLPVGTGADTSAKLTVGANDTILMADSGQSTGLKWVASQTPSTQAFSDAAAEGTADTYARGDHKHAMPANPGSAVVPWSIAPDGGAAPVANSTSGSANRAIYVPATIPAACTITGIRVSIAVSSGNVCVGLYDSSANRVATSGSVACPSFGARTVSFTGGYSATAGRYYLAIVFDNNTASFAFNLNAADANSGVATANYEAFAFPLPSTASFTTPIAAPAIIGIVSGGFPT